ncbi:MULTISPECIES: phage tail tape measure protein [unclassified Microbacterium]|uniref:phage tail tape measure protein n=1 Tax=unclassified Microbacterium TaxID=2609290 RepID=UPI00386E32F4
MVDRIVKVTLRAQVAEYNAGMLKAAQATRTVGTEAEKLAQKRQAFEQLGRVMMTSGGLIAAGVGLAVKKFADFDQAMSNVAATGEDARNSLDALREAAIEAGARTVFSATEAANAIEEMAKAGVDAKDILGGGLNGALDLAAAGGIEVAEAAGIAATALKVFKLEGTDMSHVADLLAAGAGKAMGDVTDLSAALAQGGQVAAATGLSIEETTAALASFASQGLLGSDAGTALKTMLQRLNPTTKEAQDQFDALGISAYDANGQFVGLADFSGQLQTAMQDMTPEARNAAMAVMFGSDAVRAANVLYQEGESGIREWTAAVDDQGYAAETARTRLDNLKGDIEALGGAFDSALIQVGSAADGPLRAVVQGLTEIVDGFNGLPDGAQNAVFAVGLVTAAVGLTTGAFFLAVPKIAEFNTSLQTMGPLAQRAGRGLATLARLGAIGAAVGIVTLGVDALSDAIAKNLLPSTEQVESRMRGASSGVELFAAALYKEGITNTKEAGSLLANLGDELDRVADSSFWNQASTSGTAVTVAKELAAIANSGDMETFSAQFRALAEDADLSERQLRTFIKANPELQDALLKQANATGGATDIQSLLNAALGETPPSVEQNTEALRALAGQAGDTDTQIEGLADTIRGFGSSVLDTREAQRGFEQAFDDLSDSIKENGKTLDVSTEKGRANQAAVDDLASATYDYAAAIYDQTGSQEKASEAVAEGRKRLIDMLGQLGITGQKAEDYADKLGLIPENVSTAIAANADAATARVQRFLDYLARIPTSKTVTLGVAGGGVGALLTQKRATGGAILGPGTGTSDSIPAMLSNGEHVIPASEVAAAGGQAKIYEWRRAMRDGTLPGFASGGAVTLKGAIDAVNRAESKLRKARSKKKREAAKEELADAREELADVRREFRSEQVDFNRAQRRGENREAGMNGNGLSLVDQLIDIATDVGGKRGERLRKQALTSEKAYLRLEKAADDAAKKVDASASKLDGLKDTVRGWASSVSDAFKRTMDPSQWKGGTRQVAQSRLVDGVTVTSTTTRDVPMTAATIANGSSANAKQIKRVADKLAKLRKMGFNPAYVLEIAQMGVEGEPIVDALLAATSTEMATINRTWTDAGKFADAAGMGIANAQVGAGGKSYEALITAADKQYKADRGDAESTRKKLQTETDRIIKAIGGGLQMGVKKAAGGPITGPGTATSDSIAAWLSNGENVWSAADVQAHGGQSEVERLKRMTPTAPRFAHGGPVGSGWAGRAPVSLTVVNPQVRDLQKDTFESAQILSVAGDL